MCVSVGMLYQDVYVEVRKQPQYWSLLATIFETGSSAFLHWIGQANWPSEPWDGLVNLVSLGTLGLPSVVPHWTRVVDPDSDLYAYTTSPLSSVSTLKTLQSIFKYSLNNNLFLMLHVAVHFVVNKIDMKYGNRKIISGWMCWCQALKP